MLPFSSGNSCTLGIAMTINRTDHSDRTDETPLNNLFGNDECEHLADRFKLLGESVRLRILTILCDGERNVQELCEQQDCDKQMFRRIYQMIVGIGLAIALFNTNPAIALAQSDPAELAKAVQEIEVLDSLRSGLASTLEGRTEEPTMQTMKEVCKPVAMRAMQLSQENPWQVKQIASKYRNPDHAPDNLHSKIALARFEKNPDLMGFWDREMIDGQEGTRYYRRIHVEASCLACHGAENNRPQFVKDNYPQDLAFNFQVGDLRGMYAVFIPDVKAALEQAIQE